MATNHRLNARPTRFRLLAASGWAVRSDAGAVRECHERNPSHHTAEIAGVAKADELPVENVSWNDAEEFCRKLSALPKEIAAGRHYRLPTEAEWEYACRAGKSEAYNWHSSRPAADDSGENSGISPSLPITPVGSYRRNPFGLYDMRGNVWEWTADWFDRSYYSRSPVNNPQGPAEGYMKVAEEATGPLSETVPD